MLYSFIIHVRQTFPLDLYMIQRYQTTVQSMRESPTVVQQNSIPHHLHRCMITGVGAVVHYNALGPFPSYSETFPSNDRVEVIIQVGAGQRVVVGQPARPPIPVSVKILPPGGLLLLLLRVSLEREPDDEEQHQYEDDQGGDGRNGRKHAGRRRDRVSRRPGNDRLGAVHFLDWVCHLLSITGR